MSIGLRKTFNLSLSTLIWGILISRASLDPLFEIVKQQVGIGPGALLNMLVIVLGFTLIVKSAFILPKYAIIAWGGFLAISLLAVGWSPFRGEAFRSFLTIVTYFFMFMIPFYIVRSNDDFLKVIKLIFLASLIPLLMGLSQIFTGGFVSFGGFERVYGTFSHPNIFAFYLAFLLMVLMYLHFTRQITKVFSKKTAIIFGGLVLSLLFLTQTRSAWLSVIVFMVVYAMLIEQRYLLYIVIFGGLAFFVPSVQERILDLFQGNDINAMVYGDAINSYAWRKLLWSDALVYVADKPLFGWGLATFRFYSQTFFSLANEVGTDAHNIYVQTLFDCGWLGLVALVWMFFYVLIDLFSFSPLVSTQGRVSLIAILIAYCVTAYGDNMLAYLSYNWYFWFFIGSYLSYKFHVAEDASAHSLTRMETT